MVGSDSSSSGIWSGVVWDSESGKDGLLFASISAKPGSFFVRTSSNSKTKFTIVVRQLDLEIKKYNLSIVSPPSENYFLGAMGFGKLSELFNWIASDLFPSASVSLIEVRMDSFCTQFAHFSECKIPAWSRSIFCMDNDAAESKLTSMSPGSFMVHTPGIDAKDKLWLSVFNKEKQVAHYEISLQDGCTYTISGSTQSYSSIGQLISENSGALGRFKMTSEFSGGLDSTSIEPFKWIGLPSQPTDIISPVVPPSASQPPISSVAPGSVSLLFSPKELDWTTRGSFQQVWPPLRSDAWATTLGGGDSSSKARDRGGRANYYIYQR